MEHACGCGLGGKGRSGMEGPGRWHLDTHAHLMHMTMLHVQGWRGGRMASLTCASLAAVMAQGPIRPPHERSALDQARLLRSRRHKPRLPSAATPSWPLTHGGEQAEPRRKR